MFRQRKPRLHFIRGAHDVDGSTERRTMIVAIDDVMKGRRVEPRDTLSGKAGTIFEDPGMGPDRDALTGLLGDQLPTIGLKGPEVSNQLAWVMFHSGIILPQTSGL